MNRITTGALCAGAIALSAVLTLGHGLPAAAASPTLSGAVAATALQSPQLGLLFQSQEDSRGQTQIDEQASPDQQAPANGQSPSQGQSPSESQTQPQTNAEADLDQAPASAAESTGIVLVETELGYESAASAGTGILLDDEGTILTNNHVIADSTSITVTLADSGETYEATVVGSDSTQDVAVLTIDPESASSGDTFSPAAIATDVPTVGDDVTAVGNAGGGGTLQAADGTVTDLDASVTTAAQGTAESESLSGMIEVDADIVAGDSGGALLDADGAVVGMNTAASQGSADITGYAIPIDDALDTAQDILGGVQTETNTLGYPAFLGVTVGQSQPALPSERESLRGRGNSGSSTSGSEAADPSAGEGTSTGATVSGVVEGTPAAEVGLAGGDTITGVDDAEVSDGQQLTEILGEHSPGDQVEVTWVDSAGAAHSATVTLAEGPAA